MSTDYKFQGWLGESPEAVKGKMVFKEYTPKTWEETDVDIEISHCGICGSDLHTLRSGWAPTNYPCCVGHEIVGKAVKVGKHAEGGIKYAPQQLLLHNDAPLTSNLELVTA